MNKKSAVECLKSRTSNVETKKKLVKDMIRIMADEDEGFCDIVFELGCSVLAKEYMKQEKRKGRRTNEQFGTCSGCSGS